jgi:hypothetical protein
MSDNICETKEEGFKELDSCMEVTPHPDWVLQAFVHPTFTVEECKFILRPDTAPSMQ